jgi:hypothetical protein
VLERKGVGGVLLQRSKRWQVDRYNCMQVGGTKPFDHQSKRNDHWQVTEPDLNLHLKELRNQKQKVYAEESNQGMKHQVLKARKRCRALNRNSV